MAKIIIRDAKIKAIKNPRPNEYQYYLAGIAKDARDIRGHGHTYTNFERDYVRDCKSLMLKTDGGDLDAQTDEQKKQLETLLTINPGCFATYRFAPEASGVNQLYMSVCIREGQGITVPGVANVEFNKYKDNTIVLKRETTVTAEYRYVAEEDPITGELVYERDSNGRYVTEYLDGRSPEELGERLKKRLWINAVAFCREHPQSINLMPLEYRHSIKEEIAAPVTSSEINPADPQQAELEQSSESAF